MKPTSTPSTSGHIDVTAQRPSTAGTLSRRKLLEGVSRIGLLVALGTAATTSAAALTSEEEAWDDGTYGTTNPVGSPGLSRPEQVILGSS